MKELFDRWFIAFGRFIGVDIIMVLSDALHTSNKRVTQLETGIHDVLYTIPNCIMERPEVTILENALYTKNEDEKI